MYTGYARNDFLKPARLTIHLPPSNSRNQVQPKNYSSAQKRVRIFLKDMLSPMLKVIEESDNPKVGHPLLRKLGIESSVRELSTQIDAFWNGEYPFRVIDGDRSKITDPLEWWCNIEKFDHANLISVRS
jgi:hypothetical protein